MNRTRSRTAALVIATIVAFTGCVGPFPGAGPDGTGPDITWITATEPLATSVLGPSDGQLLVEVIANPVEPAWADCPDEFGLPIAANCTSHYLGTGFVVLVPHACRAFAGIRHDQPTPSLELDVDGALTELSANPLPHFGGGGTGSPTPHRSAVYVTVSGSGQLSYGARISFPGTPSTGSFGTEVTPRVPERDRYRVRLTCAVAEGAEPGTWVRTTYEGTVSRP